MPKTGGRFDEWFVLQRELTLEERGDSVLSGIKVFSELDERRFLVADLHIPWVRIHDEDGSLEAILGGFGDGPGEFRTVSGACSADGWIWVSDHDLGRVSRYTGSLQFDTTFIVPGSPRQVQATRDGLLLDMSGGGARALERLNVVGYDLSVRSTFRPLDSLVQETPYWASFSELEATPFRDEVLTIDEMLYPIEVYDQHGQHVRDFGSPPPSWRRAPPLKFAELAGPRMAGRAQEWLSSFTVMDRIDAYRDSLIVVTHARNMPTAADLFGREQYAVDVYSSHGDKILEDVALEGATVVGGGRYIYVVRDGPPDPWVIGVYEIHVPGR
ncbi:MAG: hypothetical protein OEZ65_16035 [Gemmatimonadota bacterium]|nr:hypothetical protein [Gemmatimonadota bacterium]